ncbi:uncharacterized protein B4U80_01955, partial [Leptotrombidium deliense]
MPLQFVKSNKGSNQLVYDGYIYTRDRKYNGKELWKCVEFNEYKCLGRVHTFNDEIVKTVNEHNHVKRFEEIEARKAMNQVKEIAATTIETPQQIIATVSGIINIAAIPKLPEVPNVKRTIRRSRQRANNVPANPTSLQQIILPDKYKITNK